MSESILASIRVPGLGGERDNQSVGDAVTIRLALPEDSEIVVYIWKLVGRIVQDSECEVSTASSLLSDTSYRINRYVYLRRYRRPS